MANGIFHDKLGIFEDGEGKRVSFIGSTNETWRAWGLNHESFDVFSSWKNEEQLLRTRDHADDFRLLWLGRDPGVRTVYLEQVTLDQLAAVADEDLDHAILAVRSHQLRRRARTARRPLMEHQQLVLADWAAKDHRGIVNFATGAGKTLTALEVSGAGPMTAVPL